MGVKVRVKVYVKMRLVSALISMLDKLKNYSDFQSIYLAMCVAAGKVEWLSTVLVAILWSGFTQAIFLTSGYATS